MDTKTSHSATPASDWDIHSHQDKELVQGLGLTSATMLVMGSMIGSGIFIVSAEIAREVDSPALLIGAWLVTAIMTIIAALSYGELAAMMPRAGGQYVYLREGLGPLWGFLYGWTLFLVIQTGTIAAVGVAFGKFLGVFFPAVSSTHWILHFWRVPPIHLGADGSGQHGRGFEHAEFGCDSAGDCAVGRQYFWSEDRGADPERVHFRQSRGIAGIGGLWIIPGAQRACFGRELSREISGAMPDWARNTPCRSAPADPRFGWDALTILAVAQVGSLFSADAWNNVTFTAGEVKNPSRNLPLSLALGTGVVIALYIGCNFVYLNVLPLDGAAHGATILERGIQVCDRRPRGDRGADADVRRHGRRADGRGHHDFRFRLRQWNDSGRRARLLRHGEGWAVLPQCGTLHPTHKTPVVSLMVQMVWTCILCVSGSYGQLLDYIIFAVLVFYILTIAGAVRAAADPSRCAAALPRAGISRAARRLYCDGVIHRYRIIALQAAVHLAGADYRAAGNSGVLPVVGHSCSKGDE